MNLDFSLYIGKKYEDMMTSR